MSKQSNSCGDATWPPAGDGWTLLGDSVAIRCGDCRDVLPTLSGIHSCVTDPPYGLSFMGKAWDYDVPGVDIWQATLAAMLPGAHLLAFAGTRTQHRMACRIEDAGFEIRDMIAWVYGSGFPKSHNVGKHIDRALGAVRPKDKPISSTQGMNELLVRHGGQAKHWIAAAAADGQSTVMVANDTPITDLAKQWNGWGTALKPSMEPITLARRPLDGTVAANVLAHGCGGINVDACRVDAADGATTARKPSLVNDTSAPFGKGAAMGGNGSPLGRWPANLIHDGSDEVVGLFPVTTSGARKAGFSNKEKGYEASSYEMRVAWDKDVPSDTGSAARFFYQAKCSKKDRNEGLDNTCTVKYVIPSSQLKGELSCKDASTALAESLEKATSGSTLKWSIGESGASIMGLCPSGSLSTTLTAISRITPSEILNSLPPFITSGFIADASCETANGGSLAESADRSSPLNPTTTNESQAESARGARLVVSQMLSAISDAANWKPFTNVHSTVKPTDLMRYLCRLVTPPGGIVLDPFMGSGSTGKAAIREGFGFIGIERDPESFAIARARLEHELRQGVLPLEYHSTLATGGDS